MNTFSRPSREAPRIMAGVYWDLGEKQS